MLGFVEERVLFARIESLAVHGRGNCYRKAISGNRLQDAAAALTPGKAGLFPPAL